VALPAHAGTRKFFFRKVAVIKLLLSNESAKSRGIERLAAMPEKEHGRIPISRFIKPISINSQILST
jgi:hypothetical protein